MNMKLNFLTTVLDQTKSDADSGKRVCAYIIDWFVGALVISFPLCIAWMFKTQDIEHMQEVNLFRLQNIQGTNFAIMIGIIAFAACVWYYIWLPYKVTPGQTFGKKVMGLKMVKSDGSQLLLKDLIIRQGIGIILLEGVLCNGSSLLHDMITLVTHLNFTGILFYISLTITCISVLMSMLAPSRRMLHDYLGNTKVMAAPIEGIDQKI
ncbi:hypothetical protein C815_02281 [Firmicutes bacterium M10-2]|nr:hypothetical protein C815_02281 [Firmicutes bacterium M10-2]